MCYYAVDSFIRTDDARFSLPPGTCEPERQCQAGAQAEKGGRESERRSDIRDGAFSLDPKNPNGLGHQDKPPEIEGEGKKEDQPSHQCLSFIFFSCRDG